MLSSKLVSVDGMNHPLQMLTYRSLDLFPAQKSGHHVGLNCLCNPFSLSIPVTVSFSVQAKLLRQNHKLSTVWMLIKLVWIVSPTAPCQPILPVVWLPLWLVHYISIHLILKDFNAASRGTDGWSLDDAYVERAQWKTLHILGTVDCMKTDRWSNREKIYSAIGGKDSHRLREENKP